MSTIPQLENLCKCMVNMANRLEQAKTEQNRKDIKSVHTLEFLSLHRLLAHFLSVNYTFLLRQILRSKRGAPVGDVGWSSETQFIIVFRDTVKQIMKLLVNVHALDHAQSLSKS